MAESHTVGHLAQIACLLEATARKPGNVHRFADFDDCGYLDFALSAQAIGPVIDRVHELGIGRTILEGVRATRAVVSTNTNLGILLLLVPLAAVPPGIDLRTGLKEVLRGTTVDDAKYVYEAIRLANPGGLGKVEEHDVAEEPVITLLEAMNLATKHDNIALQYATNYRHVFRVGLAELECALSRNLPLEAAIILAHLRLMAACPDSLIARKLGIEEALEASRRARFVFQTGWPTGEYAKTTLKVFDDWLRAEGHARNPGTTADLVAATLFAALRAGFIRLPLDRPYHEQIPC